MRPALVQHGDELGERHVRLASLGVQDACAAPPDQHDPDERATDDERHPATLRDLERIGGEKDAVDDDEGRDDRQRGPERPAPAFPDDEEGHDRGDDHRTGDGDAVGVREGARILEHRDEQQHEDEQQDIHLGQIDLPFFAFRRPADLHPRHEAELDRLLRQREGAGDDRLARDHGCDRGHPDHRQERPVGVETEERILDLRRIGDEERALADIVEGKAWQHEAEPRGPDRAATEMAHVRIEGFGAGDGKEDRAERHEPRRAVRREEGDAVGRADRGKDCGIVGDVENPPSANRMNHRAVIGPNQAATLAVPWLCTAESPTRMARLSGSTKRSKAGVASVRPSTAERTEIAGVIIASP